MISGYLPFLLLLGGVLLPWGMIGAVDGWLRGIKTARVDLNRPTLLGFLGGCAKGVAFLIIFTLIGAFLPVLVYLGR